MDCSIALCHATLGAADGDYDAVVSVGMGDVRVLRVRDHIAVWCTDAQYPLRAPPPLVATRPFLLEAAYTAPSGMDAQALCAALCAAFCVAPLSVWHSTCRSATSTIDTPLPCPNAFH